MAEMSPTPDLPLHRIAFFLFARREILLNAWRAAVNADPTLHRVSGLTRDEFNDQIPSLLHILNQRLRQEKYEANPAELAR